DGLANATKANVRWQYWHINASINQTLIKDVITRYNRLLYRKQLEADTLKAGFDRRKLVQRSAFLSQERRQSGVDTTLVKELLKNTNEDLAKNTILIRQLQSELARVDTMTRSQLRAVLGDLEEAEVEKIHNTDNEALIKEFEDAYNVSIPVVMAIE